MRNFRKFHHKIFGESFTLGKSHGISRLRLQQWGWAVLASRCVGDIVFCRGSSAVPVMYGLAAWLPSEVHVGMLRWNSSTTQHPSLSPATSWVCAAKMARNEKTLPAMWDAIIFDAWRRRWKFRRQIETRVIKIIVDCAAYLHIPLHSTGTRALWLHDASHVLRSWILTT